MDKRDLDAFAEAKADELIMTLNSLPEGTSAGLIIGTVKGRILKILEEFQENSQT